MYLKNHGENVFCSKVSTIEQYTLQPIPFFPLVNEVNIHEHFMKYRNTAYQAVQSHSFTNQHLLSLSNIILLTQSEPLEFLSPSDSEKFYNFINTPLFQDIPSLSSTCLTDLNTAFLSFASTRSTLAFSSDIIAIAKKSSDSVLHSLLHPFVSLSHEITSVPVSSISEMHVQSSFIQPLLRGITKSMPLVVPHCSNKLAFENEHSIMHCRPDYRVDLYNETGTYDGTNLFGELKPATAMADDVLCDFQKCMSLGKLALKIFNYDYVMTFYSVGTSLHFYMHHSLNNHLSYAFHLHSFEIPTSPNNFINYSTLIPILYRLSQIYRLHCIPQQLKIYTPLSSSLPYPIIKYLIRQNKKRKLSYE